MWSEERNIQIAKTGIGVGGVVGSKALEAAEHLTWADIAAIATAIFMAIQIVTYIRDKWLRDRQFGNWLRRLWPWGKGRG